MLSQSIDNSTVSVRSAVYDYDNDNNNKIDNDNVNDYENLRLRKTVKTRLASMCPKSMTYNDFMDILLSNYCRRINNDG